MNNIISLQNYVLCNFLIKLMNDNVLLYNENSENPLNLVIPQEFVVTLCQGVSTQLGLIYEDGKPIEGIFYLFLLNSHAFFNNMLIFNPR